MSSGSFLEVQPDTSTISLPVSGFGAGDTVEFLHIATGVITSSYTPNAKGGIFTVTGHGESASLQLFGQYTATGFFVSQLGNSVEIKYTPPTSAGVHDLAAGGHH
jgi:hypothetical protein